MKVVIDTNLLLSGLLWKGLPGKLIEHWKEGVFQVVITDAIFAEYQTVLKRFSGDHDINVDEVMQTLGERGVWCPAAKLSDPVCSDPDDDKFIAAALGGNARYIISGDKALLAVESFGGVEILTARRFFSIAYP